MAPDTSLQRFVGAPASMTLPPIPLSPRTLRDAALDDELIDPDAKLILSDFTQITEYFPMDLYRSMFFINTLDHDYNLALDTFDQLARKLYDTSLSDSEVSKIKFEMSRNLNLMMANRNETLAEATRLYETADQSFNTLDNSIAVAEDNLQNPPSESYFLPSPPPDAEEDEDLSDLGSSDEDMDLDEAEDNEEDDDSGASVKTVDLKPSHLTELELKALRRRMKKSFTWMPKQACVKKELQMCGRWPLHVSSAPDKAARRKLRLAKIKRKRQRQLRVIQRERVAAARKAAAQARAQAENLKAEQLKKKKQVQYTMPVAENEPTYCYCGDVSYGEMIACENEECPREWFHLECAGLTTAPKGKWYCRDCKPEGHVRRKR